MAKKENNVSDNGKYQIPILNLRVVNYMEPSMKLES